MSTTRSRPEAAPRLIGVPAFRLPRDVIELDVNWVAKHGVQFHYNVEIGRDVTLQQLRDRHDAVVAATGCMYPVAMNVPGEELDGVIYGVDFLKRANLGQPQWVGEHVVVIGGGYTAMDSSRTALRLGAKTSTILYRRGPEEMVVDEEEQHETRFEGVRVPSTSRRPVEVLAGPDGHVNGMVFQRTRLGPPDASGRRSAEPIPGSEFTVPCDMVIPCTSQASDNNVLGEFGAKLNRHVGVVDTRTVIDGRVALVVAHAAAERLDAARREGPVDERPAVRLQPRQRRHQRRQLQHERRRRLRGRRLRDRPGDDHRGCRDWDVARPAPSTAGSPGCAASSSRSCRSSTAR